MRQLYLAATGQNRGKTTAALGLFIGHGVHAIDTGAVWGVALSAAVVVILAASYALAMRMAARA